MVPAHCRARASIVVRGDVEKFRQNAALAEFLTTTADKVLVEASPYDASWGSGRAEEGARSLDPLRWPGLNLLGFALMEVREQLRT